MDKNLENKVRTLISFNRGLIAKPENLEDVKEEFDKYAKVCSTKPLEDNFYMFDCKTKGYYKFSCGEGWYYEGVIFKK